MKKHFIFRKCLLYVVIILILLIPSQLNCRPAIIQAPFLTDWSMLGEPINGLFPFNPVFIRANHIRKVKLSGKTQTDFPTTHVFSFDKNGNTLQCITSNKKEIIQGLFYEYNRTDGMLSTRISVSYGTMTISRYFYDTKENLKTVFHFKVANNSNFQVYIHPAANNDKLLDNILTVLSGAIQQKKATQSTTVFPVDAYRAIVIDDAWYQEQLTGNGPDLNIERSDYFYSTGDTCIYRITGKSYYRENGVTTSDKGISYTERYIGRELLSRTITDGNDPGAALQLFEYKNGRASARYDTHTKERLPAANTGRKLLLNYNPEGVLSGFTCYKAGRKTGINTLTYTSKGLPEKMFRQSEEQEWQPSEQEFNYEYY